MRAEPCGVCGWRSCPIGQCPEANTKPGKATPGARPLPNPPANVTLTERSRVPVLALFAGAAIVLIAGITALTMELSRTADQPQESITIDGRRYRCTIEPTPIQVE